MGSQVDLHISTQVRDKMTDDWDTQVELHRSAHVYKHLFKVSTAFMGGWVDRYTCTNACTHANQGTDQKRGDWEMFKGPHWSAHGFATL